MALKCIQYIGTLCMKHQHSFCHKTLKVTIHFPQYNHTSGHSWNDWTHIMHRHYTAYKFKGLKLKYTLIYIYRIPSLFDEIGELIYPTVCFIVRIIRSEKI